MCPYKTIRYHQAHVVELHIDSMFAVVRVLFADSNIFPEEELCQLDIAICQHKHTHMFCVSDLLEFEHELQLYHPAGFDSLALCCDGQQPGDGEDLAVLWCGCKHQVMLGKNTLTPCFGVAYYNKQSILACATVTPCF